MRQSAFRIRCWRGVGALLILGVSTLFTACTKSDPDNLQGYVEGQFVYVASPLSGELETLSVERGRWVTAGDPLFALERGAETAARDVALGNLEEARARLEDARKGKRTTEIASLQAQLQQNQEALVLSEKEFARMDRLAKTGAVADSDLDRARSTRDQDRARVVQITADLETAKLGSREDLITAAEATVRSLTSSLDKSEWDLCQKEQTAPRGGLVFDILYRVGDWVAAGRPVVALLPPDLIKVRAFVPEPQIGSIQVGDPIDVHLDGVDEPIRGKIGFISPQAEYTPPVIYSEETRSKLVFLIEVVFPAEVAARLHPGQPVGLELVKEK